MGPCEAAVRDDQLAVAAELPAAAALFRRNLRRLAPRFRQGLSEARRPLSCPVLAAAKRWSDQHTSPNAVSTVAGSIRGGRFLWTGWEVDPRLTEKGGRTGREVNVVHTSGRLRRAAGT